METITAETVREALSRITDPEIPVLTIEDLGILRTVDIQGDKVVVTITPTYSGCPAMDSIRQAILTALADLGVARTEIRTVYSPAWSTEWISPKGRRKLEEFGIAPPLPPAQLRCPRCRASNPRTVSEFGSTACKALMVCTACGEPFDRFKEL